MGQFPGDESNDGQRQIIWFAVTKVNIVTCAAPTGCKELDLNPMNL
jgi:hypothetical protein